MAESERSTGERVDRNDPKARDKAIELAVGSIEKQFGKGSIMRLGNDQAAPEVKVVPTGSLGLDIALGVGGLPRGRIVEIYGPESSGKTTLTLHAIAEGQRRGGICAFIDAEHALDVTYARKLGVKTDDLLGPQPDCRQHALQIHRAEAVAVEHRCRPAGLNDRERQQTEQYERNSQQRHQCRAQAGCGLIELPTAHHGGHAVLQSDANAEVEKRQHADRAGQRHPHAVPLGAQVAQRDRNCEQGAAHGHDPRADRTSG